ncbi:MAG TPA: permease-like cell division protein FtsX [Acidimicrobiia bacterium]|nr:permease-like cell division protein FtsX [Acidimicrobiia bacterium]
MLSRFFYFLRETFISLRRNISMTIAAILTIFVTLSLVGVATLVFFWNAQGTATVEKAVRFEVFMLPNAQQAQIDDVRKELEQDKKDEKVSKITFYSKEEAFDFFKKSFKDEKDLIKSITKDDLPVSFLVAPQKPDKKFVQDLIDTYSSTPGVDKVTFANFEDDIQRARVINRTLAVFAAVLLIASCVLVFNTVRLAVYARRREIEIMKLVGASNWFVQVPFMAEGAVQGLVGGVFASVSVFIFQNAVLDKQFSTGFKGFAVSATQLWGTAIMVVFLGIAIGFVSSYVGLKRYLDV